MYYATNTIEAITFSYSSFSTSIIIPLMVKLMIACHLLNIENNNIHCHPWKLSREFLVLFQLNLSLFQTGKNKP